MNIKYVPQKSEKFSFILILGCVASILIFLLYSFFFFLMHLNVNISENAGLIFILNIVTLFSVYYADFGILRLLQGYCNKRFLKAYLIFTILLGFYTEWAYALFFVQNNIDRSAQFLNITLNPLFVIKETFRDLSFVGLFLRLSLVAVAKYFAIKKIKENNVYCNNCKKWPEKIELRLYSKDFDELVSKKFNDEDEFDLYKKKCFEQISQKFNDDVNCLLSLQVIHVFSIEMDHDQRTRKFWKLGVEELPPDVITKLMHIKVKINHCSKCNLLNTISIYSVEYIDGRAQYSAADYSISPTYILTKEQFEAFQLKQHEKKIDFYEIAREINA